MKRKPNNPRQISEREFERLAADLERFGDLGGVVHNETTGNFVGGNQRSSVFELERQGAQITVTETYAEPTRTGTVARGYVEWRGERYDYRRVRWDKETEDAACLVANLRGGTWDFDALSAWDGDLLKGIGFDGDLLAAWNDQAANLRELLESEKPEPVEDAGAQVDKAEELREKWGVETGHLWQLGEHRLICGDCTDKAVVAAVMQGEPPFLMVTDPPYGVNYDPMFRQEALGAADRRAGRVQNDTRSDWREAWALFPGDVAYCWSGMLTALDLLGSFWAADFAVHAEIVWSKPHLPFGRGHYVARHESCWYLVRRGATAGWAGQGVQSTVWDISLDETADGGHGTQKPLECMERPVRNHDSPIVYDPFLGSGTTLIACERLGRKCRAIEISPAYCAVAIERWVQTTGGTPVLISS